MDQFAAEMGQGEAHGGHPDEGRQGETPGLQGCQPGRVAHDVEGDEGEQAQPHDQPCHGILGTEQPEGEAVPEAFPHRFVTQGPGDEKGDQGADFRADDNIDRSPEMTVGQPRGQGDRRAGKRADHHRQSHEADDAQRPQQTPLENMAVEPVEAEDTFQRTSPQEKPAEASDEQRQAQGGEAFAAGCSVIAERHFLNPSRLHLPPPASPPAASAS